MKRGDILVKIFFAFVILSFMINVVSSLGIRPAKIELNFQPGFERSFEYTVLSKNSDTKYELYTKGDLAEYVELDKSKVTGSGTFVATLKLPSAIDVPGKHRILIGVKQSYDEELVGTGIGTAVAIQGVIDVYAPYPGKYLDVSIKTYNVNAGEPVDFEIEIISQGKEDVSVTPRIEITSEDELIETLYLKNREIKSQESISLHKVLDTTNYNPGKYKATAIVDYGTDVARAETEFNIGELVIHLVNHTKQIVNDGIQKFNIVIESGWNNQIDGAYADISIKNGSINLISFKTSTTTLIPWERKNITGFFDAGNFSKGIYDANITLIYYGKDVGRSSSEIVRVEFIEKPIEMKTLVVAGLIVLLVLVAAIVVIRKYLLKKGKKK